MTKRHTNRLAPYLVLIQNHQILLLRRANTGYHDGDYSLPAGHVDPNESFSQALFREMAEEIGIKINPQKINLVHLMHRKDEQGNEYVNPFFTITHWTGTITNKEPHKCDDLSWHPIDNLPANTIPYIKFVLTQINQDISYSEFGWE